MKINTTLTALLLASLITTGCSNSEDEQLISNATLVPPTAAITGFAPDDGAQSLNGSDPMSIFKLLRKAGPDIAAGFGEISIQPKEYEEIKAFTDNLVKDCTTDTDKYNKIFKWVYGSLKYEHEYEGGDIISNDPYPVFVNKVAICQGFANLQHIMLESQGIPTLNVNGEYVGVGGHAWNYVFVNKKWVVSDPTNNGSFPILSTGKYKHLRPFSIDANIFETEDCCFTFSDCALNINEIKATGSQFVVPYSVQGYKVTSLSPRKPVPASIKEIYIGKNIETLGEYYRGLDKNAPSIEMAYVDPQNRKLKSYTGVVYRKNGINYQIYYTPAALKKMELLSMKVVEKNTVFENKGLEEVIIPNTTEEVCDYAFEKCPNLKIAYIPASVKVAERAFWDVHPDFKIIRADYTGIPEIRL